jgi:hypothetical protein
MDHFLSIQTLKKEVRITHVFKSEDEANAFMASNENYGVIAVINEVVFLAKRDNLGDNNESC